MELITTQTNTPSVTPILTESFPDISDPNAPTITKVPPTFISSAGKQTWCKLFSLFKHSEAFFLQERSIKYNESMSSRRERSGGSSREFTSLTRREEIIRRNHDRARRRLQVRATMGRESVETAERNPRTDTEQRRFDRRRSLHDRPRIAQRRRLEIIARRPGRRHSDNAHFREPTVSHRIVGRDVDVNEDRMFDLLPAPDQDLHMRTWRSLNIVYTKASIVEMVTGLNREEYMEFARIIMTGLPTSSVREMRRRGMIEELQRVLDLGNIRDSCQGYDDHFNQGYNDNGYDQSDLEDGLVSNPDSEDIEISSIPKQRSHRRALPDADISSDEPMDDYMSTDNDNDDLYGRSTPKSVDHLRLNSRSKPSRVSGSPNESLRQSDQENGELLQEASVSQVLPSISVVPPALLLRPKSRSYDNILGVKTMKSPEAEIRRFRECVTTVQQTASGRRSRTQDKLLDEYLRNCAHLVGSLQYEAMLQNVFDILSKGDWVIPAVDPGEPHLEADIPSNIYRVITKVNCAVVNSMSIRGRLLEAHNYLNIHQVVQAEIMRRKPLPLLPQGTRDAIADIKFDMACVDSKQTKENLMKTQTTNKELYTTIIGRIIRMVQYGSKVAAYTDSMGSSASLLIWPSMAIHDLTRFPILRTNLILLEGISIFIKGSHEFQAIQNLIDHLSSWFESWMAGSISSAIARERLDAFLGAHGNSGLPPGKSTAVHISCNTATRDHPGNELRQLIKMFAELPRADNITYSTVGTTGHDMSLNITDMKSLGSQKQLTERAIEAVLATTKFPDGVMFARASGYGSLYDQQEYEHERSMLIHHGIKTILCPIHTGNSAQHWVGVVVRLDYERRGRPGISVMLLDSMATDTYNAAYDEKVIKNIVVTWLGHRLPDFKSFPSIGEMARPRVEQQEDLNSCGVHMLLNLRAAGLDGKYISKGGNCTSKEWIDDARKSFVKRILRSAGKHLGGDIERSINKLLDESGLVRRELRIRNASASRGVSPHLGP